MTDRTKRCQGKALIEPFNKKGIAVTDATRSPRISNGTA